MAIKISEMEEANLLIGDDYILIIQQGSNKKVKLEKVKEMLEQRITTGEEYATNEYIDGKQVYRKRISCGNLLASGIKRVAHNTTFSEIVRVEGMCNGGGYFQPLPYVAVAGMGDVATYSVCMCVDTTQIYLVSGKDMSAFVAYVDLYYTK